MTYKRAIQVLKDYNDWRRHEGEPTPYPHSGAEIGAAIDIACHALWQMDKISEIASFGKGGNDGEG
jgi:hypothetical protein